MSIYTVHEPPLRAGVTASDAERYVFVRDGFSFRAFLFGPLWMLWHRMWLVLTGYILVAAAIETLIAASDASAFAVGIVGVLISLLVGLEAGTLRRFTLRRRGWRNVGIVSGDGLEAAERRFFESWVRHAAQPGAPGAPGASAPATPAASPPPSPRTPQPPEVIGLFPEPGANR